MITVFDMASGQQDVAEPRQAQKVAAPAHSTQHREVQLQLLTVDEALDTERRTQRR
ncbi:hypothetical protein [Chitinimonas naiadis]